MAVCSEPVVSVLAVPPVPAGMMNVMGLVGSQPCALAGRCANALILLPYAPGFSSNERCADCCSREIHRAQLMRPIVALPESCAHRPPSQSGSSVDRHERGEPVGRVRPQLYRWRFGEGSLGAVTDATR